jgi:hypothetical protein
LARLLAMCTSTVFECQAAYERAADATLPSFETHRPAAFE